MVEFRKLDGNIRTKVFIDDSSERQTELMGVDVCSISFDTPKFIAFEFGDYLIYEGKKYTLNTPPRITKIHNRAFRYQLTLEGEINELAKVNYNGLDRNNELTKLDFQMYARADEYITLIINNMNRLYKGWKSGYIINSEERKPLDIQSTNCLDALNQIAKAFDTEYFVEDKTVNLYKKQPSSGIILRYGEIIKSVDISPQNNANYVTRLYVQGGQNNLEATYRYGATRLQLGDDKYLEVNNNLPPIEGSIIFDDIYPHRTGYVSTYNIENNSFTDLDLDFDLNDYYIPNIDAKVTFTSGQLMNKDFKILQYTSVDKRISIEHINDNGNKYPNELIFPAIGDSYVITGIKMPSSYYLKAEQDLKNKGLEYLNQKVVNIPIQYDISCNDLYLKQNSKDFKIGYTVGIDLPDMGINDTKRIISITKGITQPYRYKLTLADTIKENLLIKLL